ncbi:Retrovirus-related Pol polyprotein from type-1 retrotransposable element R1 [Araneus ventricosus]|uniref:Retrovirus-related Pol polyprotein from type-1 retrotransposable element R1 n=1 Tax=Araneus ventricosus TaxID=182803 RepID=A0A4Y2C0H8_ARAVE|nr:Retrovirus-related Pol polyprotein from type-1 retrotransposable element R1 [Araneus ventricosus]
MYQISEFFHIKRCNFCQAYGHTTKNCHHNIPSCATCAGYHSTRDCLSDYCFCGYLGRSLAGTQELPNLSFGHYPDVYIVQEPYDPKKNSFGLPLKWKTIISHSGKVLLSVRNPAITLLVKSITEHVVAAELSAAGDHITVVAFYFPPSLPQSDLVRELDGVCSLLQDRFILLAGDVNTRSPLWGPEVQDHRHHDEGGPLVDFILARNFFVWNDSASLPTFETDRGQSWIDITFSTQSLVPRKGAWEVHRTLLSDHNFITFSVNGMTGAETVFRPLRMGFRWLLRLAQEVADFYTINAPELHSLNSKSSLEAWVLRFDHFLQLVLSSGADRPASQSALTTPVPWWDGELEVQRKKTCALRTRFQRCRNPTERPLRRELYKREAARYRFLIKQKSRLCFEAYCTEVSEIHPFQLPYKLAAGKLRTATILHCVQRPDGSFTKSMAETVDTIVTGLFPLDDSSSETMTQREVRRLVSEYVGLDSAPPFSAWEIQGVIDQMAPRKAPGLDGLTVEVVRVLHQKCPSLLLHLLNKCLALGCFPDTWKTAKLVFLAKPGKEQSRAGSYLPICLLTVISKVFDKLLTQRLTFHFKSKGLLHPRQHGFRVGRSCETANNSLWETVSSALENKGKVCILSLDVAGAFDSVWRQSILSRLVFAECPDNIFNVIRDYFMDRKVVYYHGDEQWTFGAERGVPQGSCSGPFLWNAGLDTALDVGLPEGCFLQAFADNLALVVRGTSKDELAAKGTLALTALVACGALHKLAFNPSKTVLVPITYGGRLSISDPPLILMNSTIIQASGGCRYLGVWWDSGLTFSEHFKRGRRRVDVLSYRLSMIAGRFFTRRAKLFFRIYKGALEPFMLYGYGAWGHRLSLKKVRDLLNSVQRRPLVKITRAYRTTSTAALQVVSLAKPMALVPQNNQTNNQVVSGVLPLDLKAQQVYAKFRLFTLKQDSKVGSLLFKSQDYQGLQNRYAYHPLQWHPVSFSRKAPLGFDIEIFSDGSKLQGQVGSSAVLYYHGQEIQHKVCRLSYHASVFTAEIMALDMALSMAERLIVWDPIRLYTDSLSLLQAMASAQPGPLRGTPSSGVTGITTPRYPSV